MQLILSSITIILILSIRQRINSSQLGIGAQLNRILFPVSNRHGLHPLRQGARLLLRIRLMTPAAFLVQPSQERIVDGRVRMFLFFRRVMFLGFRTFRRDLSGGLTVKFLRHDTTSLCRGGRHETGRADITFGAWRWSLAVVCSCRRYAPIRRTPLFETFVCVLLF